MKRFTCYVTDRFNVILCDLQKQVGEFDNKQWHDIHSTVKQNLRTLDSLFCNV